MIFMEVENAYLNLIDFATHYTINLNFCYEGYKQIA